MVCSGRSKKTLDEAVKAIGNGVLAVQADVAKLADLDKLYTEVSQNLGKIDVLFVNAGIAKFAPLADTSESTYDEQFDINIKGAYFTVQKALPLLNDGASIILNTSVADSQGTVGANAYAATKAALRSLARTADPGSGGARHSLEHGCSRADRYAHLWKNWAAKGSHR
jgi:NAD(P)-dependent dehydrogenase (short-subunit alcohol dehydrogenase family)